MALVVVKEEVLKYYETLILSMFFYINILFCLENNEDETFAHKWDNIGS